MRKFERIIYPTGKGHVIVDINVYNDKYQAYARIRGWVDCYVGYGKTKQEAIFNAILTLSRSPQNE